MKPPVKTKHSKNTEFSLTNILKTKLKNSFKLLVTNTKGFCDNTSMHGVKYLGSKDLYTFEKSYFLLAIISVILFIGFFALKAFDKWNITPVIASINPKQYIITDEPFPAVTICNLNQVDKDKVEHFKKNSTEYAMTQMLCRRPLKQFLNSSIGDFNNMRDFIWNISQRCSDMVISCQFGNSVYDCQKLFNPVITDDGLCCVFNTVHPKFLYKIKTEKYNTNIDDTTPVEWSAEKGYHSKLPKEFYPRRTVGVGETLGLSIALYADAGNYYCSTGNGIGFRISIYNPSDFPNMREIGLLLSVGTETRIRLSNERTESALNLRSLDTQYRRCVFQDERELNFFTHYTQRNCNIECLTNIILKNCGCVEYFSPRFYGNETICGIREEQCVRRVRVLATTAEDGRFDCDDICLRSCFDLTYMPDFFSAIMYEPRIYATNPKMQNLSADEVLENIAMVNLYFAENVYRSTKQSEFIGTTDFLSSVGGIICLFFGFSFVSIAELIFFILIRSLVQIPDQWKHQVNNLNKKSVVSGKISTLSHFVENDQRWATKQRIAVK
ncbi:pickpocket protein 28-like [Teleopsis dalmanni]|uniref:pickpocket protein 28-like n=1 Tax=Teleopsis dalmanni TaxID=139649 RepID=UPI0018CEEF03|nr:pickpocket protein 28-like [Teleopsis dalmanni]